MVRRLKEDNQKIVDVHKIKEHEIKMQYEDLRSYYFRYHNFVTNLKSTIAKHELTIKSLEELRDRMIDQIADLKDQLKEVEDENEKLI